MTQHEALDILKLGHNVYLTGSAGSGKTYLLNKYINYLQEKDVAVAITASTGIAASHMNGVTIHSWSGMGIKHTLSDYDLEAMEERRYLWDRFHKTKVLVIDEISMLHHYRLDLVEKIARFFKRNDLPFGGMQVILCGDFFQLPPVTRPGEPDSHFAYHSDAWKALNLKTCYLTESHRQNDTAFLSVLNAIRTNTVNEEILSYLYSRHNKDPEMSVRPTKLYTHNVDVDSINNAELEKTEGPVHKYYMRDQGAPPLVASLKSSCLAPEMLQLKKGAQVMFVKNNYDVGYVNGTLGIVVSCTNDCVTVKTAQGKIIQAVTQEWMIEEEGKVKAKIIQMPLRLAWAITIHKSQGMTLDAAEIDLAKSFERGMGYVALSRVKSLEGLKLLGLNDLALQINEDVLMFDEDLQQASRETQEFLQKIAPKEKDRMQLDFMKRVSPIALKKEKKLSTFEKTKLLILEKIPMKDILQKRELKEETILEHIETLLENKELKPIDIEYLKDTLFTHERLEEIFHAFKKTFAKHGDYRLTPVRMILGSAFTFTELRCARLFITK